MWSQGPIGFSTTFHSDHVELFLVEMTYSSAHFLALKTKTDEDELPASMSDTDCDARDFIQADVLTSTHLLRMFGHMLPVGAWRF